MYKSYACRICVRYTYAAYVDTIRMPHLFILYVCRISLYYTYPHLSILHVCRICLYHTYAAHAYTICMPHMPMLQPCHTRPCLPSRSILTACRAVDADGDITDKQKTITALVEASSEPVSVIIVGVGDEDFEEMELLDGDTEGLVSEDGVRAQRDIVQFVAFKDCRSQEELSAQVR